MAFPGRLKTEASHARPGRSTVSVSPLPTFGAGLC